MDQYNKEQYIAKFGDKMWIEKVASLNEGREVESVYATDSGNIFMVMLAEEA